MKLVAFCAMLALSAVAVGASPLMQAIAKVESSGNPRARNGDALGLLQIRPEVVIDVNRGYGLAYRHRDAYSPEKSAELFRLYLALYATPKRLGRPVTDQDRARIWHGGPNGWKRQSTNAYWRRVNAALRGSAQGRGR